MKPRCVLVTVLAACSGGGSSGPFVVEDPHPEAKEIVYVPPGSADPAAPVIDEIRVEKDVVCDGESNLVRVKAHTNDGHDAYLAIRIPGSSATGPAIPVTLSSSMTDYGGRGWPSVQVFDWGPHGSTMPETHVLLPPIQIRGCRYPELRVDAAQLVNTDRVYECQASLRNAAGFAPVSYHWEFGDGTTADTTGPTASHDYWRMPETTAVVPLLVKVTATDARGQTLTGRLAWDWSSMELSYRARGELYVHSQRVGDRWVDADGVVYQDYLLWHHEDGPVVLDRAALDRDDPAFELSAAATLAGAPSSGTIALPAGAQTRVTVHHDFSSAPYVMAINLWLTNGDPRPAFAPVTVFNPL